jgi:dTDP-4-dehydrorhamnose reductase
MNKNILITGANGQLGSEIKKLSPLFPSFTFFFTDIEQLDLLDKPSLREFIVQNQIHYVINCAAYTAVDKAEDEPQICRMVNRDAVQNLAEAIKGKARIIHISTDYVFDGKGNLPLKETDPVNPQSVYGKTKMEGEQILMEILPESMIVRTSWLYSEFGNNFVKTMLRLGKEREQLNVVNDQFGTPTYAADLASTLLHITKFAEEENTFPSGIYHYSNESACSWYDFCLKIFELTGIQNCKVHPIPTSEYPTKATRPQYSVLDKTKIKQTFGLEIPSWEDSLKNMLSSLSGSTMK